MKRVWVSLFLIPSFSAFANTLNLEKWVQKGLDFYQSPKSFASLSSTSIPIRNLQLRYQKAEGREDPTYTLRTSFSIGETIARRKAKQTYQLWVEKAQNASKNQKLLNIYESLIRAQFLFEQKKQFEQSMELLRRNEKVSKNAQLALQIKKQKSTINTKIAKNLEETFAYQQLFSEWGISEKSQKIPILSFNKIQLDQLVDNLDMVKPSLSMAELELDKKQHALRADQQQDRRILEHFDVEYDPNSEGYTYQVSLNIPLFSWNTTEHQRKQFEIEYEKANLKHEISTNRAKRRSLQSLLTEQVKLFFAAEKDYFELRNGAFQRSSRVKDYSTWMTLQALESEMKENYLSIKVELLYKLFEATQVAGWEQKQILSLIQEKT